MQYEQPLHQVGIEPVTSGVQGTCLSKFATEFMGLLEQVDPPTDWQRKSANAFTLKSNFVYSTFNTCLM